MSDFITPNYRLTEPEVGSSSGTWGGKLNTGIGLVDRLLARPKPAIAVSTTGVLDLSAAHVQQITADADKNISFTNVPVAESGGVAVSTFVWLFVINGGAHTVTYPGSVVWTSGMAPTLKTSGVDLLLFVTGDQGAGWNAVHVGSLNDSEVTTAKIATAAVTTPKFAAGAVDSAALGANAVINEKILDGTIAQAKLAFSVQTSPELPKHVTQAFYDAQNAATKGILDVLKLGGVGLIEVS